MSEVKKQEACLIFGAREVPPYLAQKALRLCGEQALILAADAGWKQAVQNALTPDVVLGDFDSAQKPRQEDLKAGQSEEKKTEWIVLPREKDDTDLHYAAKEAVRRGVKKAVLLGVLGGRLDHSLASLASLQFLCAKGVKAMILDEAAEAYCVLPNECLRLPKKENSYISVFPLGQEAQGVYETGVRYPVQDACLTASFPLGVSNEFAEQEAQIGCKTGGLYVLVVEKDAPLL